MLKRIIWVSGLVVVCGILTILAFSTISQRQRSNILSKQDNRLADFNFAQDTADKVESLLTMDSTDYQTLYKQFKPITGESVFADYFPTPSYQGGVKSVSLIQNSVEGEIDGNRQFLFKLDLTLSKGNSQQHLIMLVTVSSGIITNIQSLG